MGLTAEGFRRIALGLKDTVESAHMGHPDFRVNGRIFATLHHDRSYGMVALTPEQQQQFMRDFPKAFAPEAGAWGRAGATSVRLDAADDETVGEALTVARQNILVKMAAAKSKRQAKRPLRRQGK